MLHALSHGTCRFLCQTPNTLFPTFLEKVGGKNRRCGRPSAVFSACSLRRQAPRLLLRRLRQTGACASRCARGHRNERLPGDTRERRQVSSACTRSFTGGMRVAHGSFSGEACCRERVTGVSGAEGDVPSLPSPLTVARARHERLESVGTTMNISAWLAKKPALLMPEFFYKSGNSSTSEQKPHFFLLLEKNQYFLQKMASRKQKIRI